MEYPYIKIFKVIRAFINIVIYFKFNVNFLNYIIDNYIYYIDKYKGESPSLKVYNIEKQEETELGKNLDYRISGSKKKILINDAGKYAVIDLPTSKISIKEYIDLTGMKVWVDYSKEWNQIFNESHFVVLYRISRLLASNIKVCCRYNQY